MDSLYREQFMEYYKNPQNRGKLDNPTVHVHGDNPFCGDEIELDLEIVDGKIQNVAFDGSACAVSVASSSLVTEEIKGKSIEEAKNLSKEKVLEMLGVELTTSRIKCATLVLETLEEAIKEYEHTK